MVEKERGRGVRKGGGGGGGSTNSSLLPDPRTFQILERKVKRLNSRSESFILESCLLRILSSTVSNPGLEFPITLL